MTTVYVALSRDHEGSDLLGIYPATDDGLRDAKCAADLVVESGWMCGAVELWPVNGGDALAEVYENPDSRPIHGAQTLAESWEEFRAWAARRAYHEDVMRMIRSDGTADLRKVAVKIAAKAADDLEARVRRAISVGLS